MACTENSIAKYNKEELIDLSLDCCVKRDAYLV